MVSLVNSHTMPPRRGGRGGIYGRLRLKICPQFDSRVVWTSGVTSFSMACGSTEIRFPKSTCFRVRDFGFRFTIFIVKSLALGPISGSRKAPVFGYEVLGSGFTVFTVKSLGLRPTPGSRKGPVFGYEVVGSGVTNFRVRSLGLGGKSGSREAPVFRYEVSGSGFTISRVNLLGVGPKSCSRKAPLLGYEILDPEFTSDVTGFRTEIWFPKSTCFQVRGFGFRVHGFRVKSLGLGPKSGSRKAPVLRYGVSGSMFTVFRVKSLGLGPKCGPPSQNCFRVRNFRSGFQWKVTGVGTAMRFPELHLSSNFW